ncbi:serine hydrolase domain-containing protein [Psychrobacter namhaensis]|uniref:serine hydrolase domain-containing protein n=1 Tax=Psychrobacter namhaensis TaxID=292734 RepID=UPI003FD2592D
MQPITSSVDVVINRKITAAASPIQSQVRPITASVDAVIDRAIEERRIIGTVVLVAHKGNLVYHRAKGLADREQNREMNEDAIFRLASMTKPLVSAAAFRLIEQGVISLQDPVTRWLPDFRPRLADGSTPVITIHHLLTHTAGLSYGFLEAEDGPYRSANISDGLDQPRLSLEENLDRINSVPLAYEPGTDWRYSVALDVLGGVLESATGKSLSEIVQQQVTGPLHMDGTRFHVIEPARLATPYQDGEPQPLKMAQKAVVPFSKGTALFAPSRALDVRAYPSGGAGMSGTAQEFMDFLLNLREKESSILKPKTISTMMQDHTGPQAQTQGPGWGFGYGWAVLDQPEIAKTPQGRGTIQWGGAYGHNWFFDPVNDIAVVAMTNTAFEGMSGAFPGEIRDAVYQSLVPVDSEPTPID